MIKLFSLVKKVSMDAWTSIQRRGQEEEYQFIILGILTILGFPIFYLIWHNFFPQTYESFTLRLIAGLIAIPLIFKNYWPKKFVFFLPIYWYLTLIYIIPFFFTFMLLKNNGALTWQLNGLMALILLLLLTDWVMVLILCAIGIAIATLAYIISTPQHHLPANFASTIGSYTPTLVFFAIFLRNRSRVEKEKLKTIGSISAGMAHELRTPLRSISFSLANIKQSFPKIVKSHDIKKIKSTLDIEISDWENIISSLEDAESELKSAFTVIDMLLVKANISVINREKFQVCSIAKCIRETLRRYPFDIGESRLIKWEECDFSFLGDELLMVHIFFNLLKNALYYIKAAGKGEIKIWCEQTEKTNILHFHDSGKGISSKILPKIFNPFFTKTYHGTGVGLSFCKYVMKAFDGDISCHSQENEFTEFLLSFPKIK